MKMGNAKPKKKWLTPVVLGVAALSLAGNAIMGVSLAGSGKSTNFGEAGSSTQTETKTEKVERTVSGKSIDEDRKDALKAVQELMVNSSKSANKTSKMETRLEELSKNDQSSINKSVVSQVSFDDFFAPSEDLKSSTYQALVSLASILVKDGKAATTAEDSYKNVFVDQKTGVAYVPVSVFQEGASLSFEMLYRDGKWVLSPYPLLDAVRMSTNLQAINSASNSADSATKK